MFAYANMASDNLTVDPLTDAQLREVVEGAFPQTNVEVVAATDESPDAYRSDDADLAWQAMHDAARGREVPVLTEMLDGSWLRGEERWKAVTFLGRSLRTGESGGMREAALRALATEAAIPHRDTVPLDAVRVQGAALDAIVESRANSDEKWQCMLSALEASRSHFGEIVRRLGGFRPTSPESVASSLPTLLDAMVRSNRVVDLHEIARLVEGLGCRSEASQLRRLLLAANADLSASIARILAAWDDREVIGEIRRAIDQYRHASDANVDVLVAALYSLDGDRSAEYVAGVFRTAPAAMQEYMLGHALAENRHPTVVRAVREVATATSDVDLKAAADAFLAHVLATPLEKSPIADTPGEAFAASMDAPPVSTENPDWAPTYDAPSSSVHSPAAAASLSAEPAAAAEEAPWRPSAASLPRPAAEPVAPPAYGMWIAVVVGVVVLLAALVMLLGE